MGFKKNFFDYYSLLNLEHMIKINKGNFMWKLVNKEPPECIQMKYHVEINTLNKNTDRKKIYSSIFQDQHRKTLFTLPRNTSLQYRNS